MKSSEGQVSGGGKIADGRRAISGSRLPDYTLKVWDLASGACERTLEGHSHKVWVVAVTPDGQRAISGFWDKTLKVWDLASGACEWTLARHSGDVWAVAVTPNGRRAISASEDKTLQVWDLASGRIEATFSSEADVKACAVSFDGVTIVAGDGFGRMHFLTTVNVPSGPPLITAVRLWQFGDNCASGHWDKRLTAVCSWCGRRSPVRDTCSAGKSPARWTRAASRSNSTRLWWMGGADDFGTRNADCGTEMRD